jgi:diacylglycerol kinase (ATP)
LRLDKEKIPYEFIESLRYFHTQEIANTLDLDKYSALVSVGGDGTIHEIINGMMHRSDKKKLPIAFIPNGSGNDTCSCLNISSVNKALDYIVKRNLFGIDLQKMTLDAESEEDINE